MSRNIRAPVGQQIQIYTISWFNKFSRKMGLFFHESDSQYTELGVDSWNTESSQPRNAAITGRFFESVSCKNKEENTFWINDQEIYCQKDGKTKVLKLCLTVMEQQLCLKHHRKAFAIKLMRDQKLTILFTYDEDLFISFYSYLSKYCILKNFRKHFKLSSKLGEGSFSTVYTGTNIYSGSEVALKVINKSEIIKLEEGLQLVINEIENLEKLRKYSLSPLIEVYETQDCIILVMQKACAGNMRQYLLHQEKNYSLSMIREIMKKVLESLKGLHAAGFIHRDIKPQNIFFLANQVHSSLILGDFGLSIDKNHRQHSKLAKLCSGTLGFIAPQVIHQSQYDQKSDLFSVGCLYYFMCTGLSIFANKSADEIFEMTYDSYLIEQKIKKIKGIDQVGRDLMRKLLVIDPKRRISAQQALKHDYFSHQAPYVPFAGEQDDTIKDYIKDRIKKYWS